MLVNRRSMVERTRQLMLSKLKAKRVLLKFCHKGRDLERAKGIEPSYRAWEALVLPLNYARIEVRKGL